MVTAGALLVAGCGGRKRYWRRPARRSASSTTATALSFNATAAVNARILTAQGQPAPDGTMVTFATTLGTVTPLTAPTAGGVATTTFSAGVASGTAIVTASSGSVGRGQRPANRHRCCRRGAPAGHRDTAHGTLRRRHQPHRRRGDRREQQPAGRHPRDVLDQRWHHVAPTNVKTDPKGIAETTLTASQRATVTVTASAAPSDPGFGTVGATQGSVVVAACRSRFPS